MDFRTSEEQDFYELLEIEKNATAAEIDAAYRRMLSIFDASAAATYTLFGDTESQSLRTLIERAYETLSDRNKRRAYDAVIGNTSAAGSVDVDDDSTSTTLGHHAEVTPVVAAVSAPAPAPLARGDAAVDMLEADLELLEPEPYEPERPAPSPAAPLESEETVLIAARPQPAPAPSPQDEAAEYSGGVLLRLRESKNITIESVAKRTKISLAHLRAIENNQFDKLPARVYVRGFVTQYAKCLDLPAARVAESYLQIYDRFHQNVEKT